LWRARPAGSQRLQQPLPLPFTLTRYLEFADGTQ
jgi:hypothetical protein